MTELSIALIALIALMVLVGLFYFQARQRDTKAILDRLEVRLDEQAKRGDSLSLQLGDRARTTEEIVRRLDRDLREQQSTHQQALLQQLAGTREQQQRTIHDLQERLLERHGEELNTLQRTLQVGVDRAHEQVASALRRNAEELGKQMGALTETTDKKLLEISGQVEKRLSEGFERTTATFTDILQRLALIDDAQKKITELSSNVVSLQEVLADRTSRGTFGEVQLHALVQNVLPESGYRMQYSLSNGKIVDCMLFLPDPTGHVPIDSKFPLENYRRKSNPDLPQEDRKVAERNFAKDIRTHLDDIAGKYIIAGETSEGAVMFIPAEAVFADIHAHYPELVEEAHRRRVWLASPTTLMAVLTTARAVLKDAATRTQVHIIQEHLGKLGEDFGRFQQRMDNLSQHIGQAHRDVDAVHKSARKITRRFSSIEQLELGNGETPDLLEGESEEEEGRAQKAAGEGL